MPLKKIRDIFIQKLAPIYDAAEADNIFHLVIENLTGIPLRQNFPSTFNPDECFRKMMDKITGRLLNNEPIQYILNEAWFYDIPFYVNPSVLIPRPETEELVDWIIKENSNKSNLVVLDVGTGSGCIPIILKRKLPFAEVIACDISADALAVAKKNADRHQAEIKLIEADFLSENERRQWPKMDILVSNPPYIPEADKANMQKNVLMFEPHQALFVPNDSPLVFYQAIAEAGKELLLSNGCIYVEIHENWGPQTLRLFENRGYKAMLKKDLQGKNRFIKAMIDE